MKMQKNKATISENAQFRNGNITKSAKESVTDHVLVFKKKKISGGLGAATPSEILCFFARNLHVSWKLKDER